MKRLILLIGMLVVLCRVLPVVAFADDGYTFDASTGTLTITSDNGLFNAAVNIGDRAYSDVKIVKIEQGVTDISYIGQFGGIRSLTIPGSVKAITEEISQGRGFMWLESVDIKEGVKSIGDNAFCKCYNLTSINIPQSVTSIGKEAFSGNVKSLVVPSGVKSIGDAAFAYLGKLETITFESEDAPTIGKDAFGGKCRILLPSNPDTNGYIGKNLSDGWENYQRLIDGDEYTFDENTATLTVNSNEGIANLPKSRYDYCTKSIIIKDGVTAIVDGGFSSFYLVQSVAIPQSVTSIGDSAFYGCSSLQSVDIPKSVKSIGHSAFNECEKLLSIEFKSPKAPSIGREALLCSQYLRIAVPKGEGVTGYEGGDLSPGWEECQRNIAGHEIDDYTFKDGLLTIGSLEAELGWHRTIKPEDVRSAVVKGAVITDQTTYSFIGCDRLDFDTFKGCKNLVSVDLQDGIRAMYCAFDGCTSIKGVTIPESVEFLSDEVFKGCSALESVTFEPKKAPGGMYEEFTGCSPDLKLYIYKGDDVSGYTGDYMTSGWEDYQQYIKLIDRPINLSYITKEVTKTYGDEKFINPITGEGDIAYTSSNPEVAIVDPKSGEVTIVNSGKTTIAATAGEVAAYTLTVSKAPLEWVAEDKSLTKGSSIPTLTYKVLGIVNSDKVKGPPSITVYTDGKTVGKFDIVISGGSVSNATNYDISYSKGTLNVTAPSPAPEPVPAPPPAPAPSGGSGGGGGSSSSMATANTTYKIDKDKVLLNVSNNSETIVVNLPKRLQDKVISEKIDNTSIMVDKPEIAINLDLDSVTAIRKQANSDVQLTAKHVDVARLSKEAASAIGTRPAYDLNASYSSGTKTVKSFGNGEVTVEIPYTLQRGEMASNVCVVYVDNNGKVSYLPNSKYSTKTQTVKFTTNHFSVYGVGYKTHFKDIENHWAKDAIQEVADAGLMSGTNVDMFSPDAPMTRGMFITTVGRMEGAVTDKHTTKFVDVGPNVYYTPYIAWATSRGLVSGTSEKTFSPDSPITREQMAVIMSKAFEIKLTKEQKPVVFRDGDKISSWAKDAVSILQQAGVLSGRSDGTFDPKATATRAEVASILNRLQK